MAEYKVVITSFKDRNQEVGTFERKSQNNEVLLSISHVQNMYEPSCLEVKIQTSKLGVSNFRGNLITLKNGNNELLKDYYIVGVKKSGEYLTLKAYSADYFLTLDKFCQAFTAKRLVEDIISPTLTSLQSSSFNIFRDIVGTQGETQVDIVDKNMQNFMNGKEESAIPYAVQFNESFYDFMVRMCNRDGEFLYLDKNNKIHIGIDNKTNSLDISSADISPLISEIEYINTYENINESTWVDKNYMDGITNFYPTIKEIAEDDSEKEKKIAENNKFYNLFGVYSPEYFTNVRKDEYCNWGDYTAEFTEIFAVLRSFAEERTVSSASLSAIKTIAMNDAHYGHFVNQNNEKFTETYKAGSNLYEVGDIRSNKNYEEIYKNQEKAGLSQVKFTSNKELNIKLGQKVLLDNCVYIVNNVTRESNPTDSSNTSFEDKNVCLLVKNIDEKFYPLVKVEERFKKASAQRAIVVDNYDPERLGRVRVLYPWQKELESDKKFLEQIKTSEKVSVDDEDKAIERTYRNNILNRKNCTPWIRISNPMASNDAGFLFVPAVNDEVLIDYEDGNIERPYVCGALYNNTNKPSIPSQSQNNGLVKSITSNNGHHISFTDTGDAARFIASVMPLTKTIGSFGVYGKGFDTDDSKHYSGGFEIADYYGVYSITGSTHDRSISINSPFGDVSINAFTGITINAPLGDVKIVGKNVSIEARNNLTLESGTNIKSSLRKNKQNGIGKMFSDFGSSFIAGFGGELLGQLDLSFVRNCLETILRPIGGTLLIKSNRYLRLEAGGGETTPNISSKNSLVRYLSKKHKLLKAKEEALSAYEALEKFRNGLLVAIINYVDNPYKEDYNDIDFFNGDNVKTYNDLNFESRNNSYYAYTPFKQLIDVVRGKLEMLCSEKSNLNGNKFREYQNEVNRVWNQAKNCFKFNSEYPRIALQITRRQLVYLYLKDAVEHDNDFSNSISVGETTNYSKEDIENSVQNKIQNSDASFLSMLKDKCSDLLLDYSGIANLIDDKIWCVSDEGAILFSDDKNTFFKVDSDGTLKKGFNNEDRDEFLKLMSDVVND